MNTCWFECISEQLNREHPNSVHYSSGSSNGITTAKENSVKYTCLIDFDVATIWNVDKGLLNKRDQSLQACDWFILIKQGLITHECFIELKKGNGEKGIKQLEDTLRQFKSKNWLNAASKRHARIVSRKLPANAGNSSLEKAKQTFKQKYQCDLKTVPPNCKDIIK